MHIGKLAVSVALICSVSMSRAVLAKGGGHGGGHSGGGHSGGGHSSGGHSSGGHSSGGHSSGGHSSGGHSSGGHSSGGHSSVGRSTAGRSGAGQSSGTVGVAVPRAWPRRPVPYAPYRVRPWSYPPILYSPYLGIAAGGIYASAFWPGYAYDSGDEYPDYGYPLSPPGAVPSDTPSAASSGASTDNGSILVDVRPTTAQVFVDGYFIGTVADALNSPAGVQLSAGPHRLELKAAGYETRTVDVLIQAGRSITFREDLTPQP